MAKRTRRKQEASGSGATKAVSARGRMFTPWYRRDEFLGFLLILAVFIVYQPVWNAGYLWDDDHHLTANPVIVGPLGLKEIWTTQAAMICPLTLTTFWVEHALWGLAPLPYHLVNVLLQGASAVLLWRVLRNQDIPGAWLGAALWALHPVQVETVAYVTELKNTQSGFFYLLTILFFMKGLKTSEKNGESETGRRFYLLTLFCAALAIASKFSTVVLPAVLGLFAWWEGRWNWRQVIRLAPVVLMSAVAIAVTLAPHSRDETRIDDTVVARSWPERLITVGEAGWFYLGKLAWPHPLMFVYPLWKIDAGKWLSFVPLVTLVAVFIVLWVYRRSVFRPCFFAFTYFLIVLSPFLGLIDEDFWTYSYVEDHLQYLASMGPLALVGAGIFRMGVSPFPARPWLPPTVGATVLVILGMLSWSRAWAFQSDENLWRDTVLKNPDCAMARDNLGVIFLDRGEINESLAQFQRAVQIDSGNATATIDIGAAFLKMGLLDKAIDQFRKAEKIDPHYPITYFKLGEALMQKEQVEGAISQFQEALAFAPDYALASNGLADAFLKSGELDKAIDQYQKTLVINSHFPGTHYDLGIALIRSGRQDEAMEQLREDIESNPQHAEAYYNVATLLSQKGEIDQALAQYQKALELRPDYADAHYNLGVALLQKGDGQDAAAQFSAVLQIDPQDRDAANNLAKAQALLHSGSDHN